MVGVDVDQDEPVAVFALGGPDQAPHRGVVGDSSSGPAPSPGQEDEAAVVVPLVGEPLLHPGERCGGPRPARPRPVRRSPPPGTAARRTRRSRRASRRGTAPLSRAASSPPTATGRTTSDSTAATGAPVGSATVMATSSVPVGASRTRRSARPPRAGRPTPAERQPNAPAAPPGSPSTRPATARAGRRPAAPGAGRTGGRSRWPRAGRPRRTPRRPRARPPAGPGRPARTDSPLGRPRVEVVDGRPARRPAAATAVRSGGSGVPPARVRVPVACRVHGSSVASWGCGSRSRNGPAPASGAPTSTWTARAASLGKDQRAPRGSVPRTRSQPTWSPARRASSTKAVPGSRTVPNTWWSASHGWVRSDSRPVNTTPSDRAAVNAAPSSGCSAPRPSPGRASRHRVAPPASSQYRWCWKAYVGRSTTRRPADTATSPPATPAHEQLADRRSGTPPARGPPSSRRSERHHAGVRSPPRSAPDPAHLHHRRTTPSATTAPTARRTAPAAAGCGTSTPASSSRCRSTHQSPWSRTARRDRGWIPASTSRPAPPRSPPHARECEA